MPLRRDEKKPPVPTWTLQPGKGCTRRRKAEWAQSHTQATAADQGHLGAAGFQGALLGLCSPRSPQTSLSNGTAENVGYLYQP